MSFFGSQKQTFIRHSVCPSVLLHFFLQAGANAQECKDNLVQWMDNLVRRYANGHDVFDHSPNGTKIDGSFSGLRSGEWGKIVEYLGQSDVTRWRYAMENNAPPLCRVASWL